MESMTERYKDIYQSIFIQVAATTLKNGHALNVDQMHKTTKVLADSLYEKLKDQSRFSS